MADVVFTTLGNAAKVSKTRLISTTSPLTGGGNLTADRTLGVDAAAMLDYIAAAPRSINILGGGLATGGGQINIADTDLTITVTEASQSEAIAGVSSTKVLTPRRGVVLVEAREGYAPSALQSRPGDRLTGYSSNQGGEVSAQTAISSAARAVDTDGAIARFTGSQRIALRQAIRIEPGRTYEARFVYRRRTNPSDPASDAVELGLTKLDKDKASLGDLVLQTETDFTISDGRTQRSFLCALSPVSATVTIPAPAIYVQPYVRLYGTDPVTDVEVVELRDVTATIGAVPDEAAVSDLLTEIEDTAATALAAIAAAAGALQVFETRADIEAATVDAGIQAVRQLGYYSVGEGEATYIRVGADPGHAGSVQSADGAWWELAERRVYADMFGVRANNGAVTTANSDAIDDMIVYLAVNTALIRKGFFKDGYCHIARASRLYHASSSYLALEAEGRQCIIRTHFDGVAFPLGKGAALSLGETISDCEASGFIFLADGTAVTGYAYEYGAGQRLAYRRCQAIGFYHGVKYGDNTYGVASTGSSEMESCIANVAKDLFHFSTQAGFRLAGFNTFNGVRGAGGAAARFTGAMDGVFFDGNVLIDKFDNGAVFTHSSGNVANVRLKGALTDINGPALDFSGITATGGINGLSAEAWEVFGYSAGSGWTMIKFGGTSTGLLQSIRLDILADTTPRGLLDLNHVIDDAEIKIRSVRGKIEAGNYDAVDLRSKAHLRLKLEIDAPGAYRYGLVNSDAAVELDFKGSFPDAATAKINTPGVRSNLRTFDIAGVDAPRSYMVGPWSITDLIASQTALALTFAGSGATYMPVFRKCRISGIAIGGTAARSAGAATFRARIGPAGGTNPSSLTAVIDGSNPQYYSVKQSSGDSLAAGDVIQAEVDTNGGWLPITGDWTVWFEITEDGVGV